MTVLISCVFSSNPFVKNSTRPWRVFTLAWTWVSCVCILVSWVCILSSCAWTGANQAGAIRRFNVNHKLKNTINLQTLHVIGINIRLDNPYLENGSASNVFSCRSIHFVASWEGVKNNGCQVSTARGLGAYKNMYLRELSVTDFLYSIALVMSSRVGGSFGTVGSMTLGSGGCGGSARTMVNRKNDTTSSYIVMNCLLIIDGPCSLATSERSCRKRTSTALWSLLMRMVENILHPKAFSLCPSEQDLRHLHSKSTISRTRRKSFTPNPCWQTWGSKKEISFLT